MSEKEIVFLKNKLLEEKNNILEESSGKGSDIPKEEEELSRASNHPGDEGTELFERQKEAALENHAFYKLEEINEALEAINDGSYGKCRVCGSKIPFERLEIKPEALFCVDHADERRKDLKRPTEEDVTAPVQNEPRSYKESLRQETWQEIEEHGTSDNIPDENDSDK